MNAGDVGTALRKRLSAHGFGFQYAVMRRGEELSDTGKSSWVLDVAEFPVVTGGRTAHIDFVLKTKSSRIYLVAECKKADPAMGRWCFVRAPYTARDPDPNEVVFDKFRCRPANIVTDELARTRADRPTYHIGLEVKTDAKGSGRGRHKSAIAEAEAQVLRATSGLINYLFDFSRRSYSQEQAFWFVPTIFTTAELWVTDADLGAASLDDGTFEPDSVDARQVDWLWLTHNRSPALRHDLEWEAAELELSKALRREFKRSIAVVSPSGIDAFLGMDMESWLGHV